MDSFCMKVYEQTCIAMGVTHLSQIKEDSKQDLTVKIVQYKLINRFYTKYAHGLKEKLFKIDFDYFSNFKYILKDFDSRPIESGKPIFDMTFIDQSCGDTVHRSGWQAVMDALAPYSGSTAPALLDLSVDRSFHWDCDVMTAVGILPYKRPWFGFIHHTFDTTFSSHNCVVLFQNQTFLNSLKTCRGLFLLCDEMSRLVKTQLNRLQFPNIPVITTFHPTEIQCTLFNYNLFQQNTIKTICHIGGWLRNTNTFYKLELPNTIEKVLLRGTFGSADIPSPSMVCQLCPGIGTILPGHLSHGVSTSCDTSTLNRFDKAFIKDTHKMINSVQLIDGLDDLAYDDFLKDKVVFLNLVDAAAVNTVIECIVRAIPIIINRLPALEEYLGIDYPLFYNNNATQTEINLFVIQCFEKELIRKAHIYLYQKGKERLHMDEFVRKVTGTIRQLTS